MEKIELMLHLKQKCRKRPIEKVPSPRLQKSTVATRKATVVQIAVSGGLLVDLSTFPIAFWISLEHVQSLRNQIFLVLTDNIQFALVNVL